MTMMLTTATVVNWLKEGIEKSGWGVLHFRIVFSRSYSYVLLCAENVVCYVSLSTQPRDQPWNGSRGHWMCKRRLEAEIYISVQPCLLAVVGVSILALVAARSPFELCASRACRAIGTVQRTQQEVKRGNVFP